MIYGAVYFPFGATFGAIASWLVPTVDGWYITMTRQRFKVLINRPFV